MTTVAKQDPADSARIKAIKEKLLSNPEMAKLIDELGTSTTDANDLVRGLLQASINRGLNAEVGDQGGGLILVTQSSNTSDAAISYRPHLSQ